MTKIQRATNAPRGRRNQRSRLETGRQQQEIQSSFMGGGAFEMASEDDGAEPMAEKHPRQGQHKQRHRRLECGPWPEGGNRLVWPEWEVKLKYQLRPCASKSDGLGSTPSCAHSERGTPGMLLTSHNHGFLFYKLVITHPFPQRAM